MAKLDLRLKESGRDSIKIEMGGRNRLLYLIIFILLTTTVFLSLDPEVDFASDRIGGTLFTFLLILISLGVTITVRSYTIDKSVGTIVKSIGLPGGFFVFSSKAYKLGSHPRFLSTGLGADYSGSSLSGNMESAGKRFLKKGQSKYILSIETEEQVLKICESSYRGDIDSVAIYISKYLGIPYKYNG